MSKQGIRILVVDDEPDMRSGLQQVLKRRSYLVETAASVTQAREKMGQQSFDLLLTDLMLPDGSGIELLELSKELSPETLVILFTGFARVESAVEAIRKGAFDYIPKPFTPQQLDVVIRRALKQRALSEENRILRGQIRDRFSYDKLIGISEAMKRVYALLRRVSDTDASILIIGESGTGKELIARAIHANSKRSHRAFQPVDCAALPSNLLESELFGFEKGAFTGANSSRKGLLEAADGGTFFLDELGELDLSMQVKFLRVLQERQFRRVGGQAMISVDVRVVAATNQDLEQAVREGRFREDLFHRLNVILVKLPPLRERQGDIALLANHFLQVFAERRGVNELRLSGQALDVLAAHHWPGNVRELQNAMEYAASLCESQLIGVGDLPVSVTGERELGVSYQSTPAPPVQATEDGASRFLADLVGQDLPYKTAKRRWLEVFEREYMTALLQRHDNNISQAANSAQIDRKSIQRILKKNNLVLNRERDDSGAMG